MILKYVGRCQPGNDGPKYGHEYEVIGIHVFDHDTNEYVMTCHIDENKQTVLYFKTLEEMCRCWEESLSPSENTSTSIHAKIVRDKIPEKIAKNGDFPKYVRLNDKYIILTMLARKLKEEVEEYMVSNSLEELADIMEVIKGILYHKNISINELEEIRRDKYQKVGGFEDPIYLSLSVSDNADIGGK